MPPSAQRGQIPPRSAPDPSSPGPGRAGFTLLEVLVVVAVAGILAAIASQNLKGLNSPLDNAQRQLQSSLTLAQTRALGSTSAVLLEVLPGGRGLQAKAASTCLPPTSPLWTARKDLNVTLPDGVAFLSAPDSAQRICFTSRGLASSNAVFRFKDTRGTRAIEVMLGGQSRRLP